MKLRKFATLVSLTTHIRDIVLLASRKSRLASHIVARASNLVAFLMVERAFAEFESGLFGLRVGLVVRIRFETCPYAPLPSFGHFPRELG